MKIKKETIKKVGKTAIRILFKVILIVVLLNTVNQVVHASSLQDTKLVTGTENLVDAIISWLVGIGITICGGYFIYYVSVKICIFDYAYFLYNPVKMQKKAINLGVHSC